MRNRKNIGITIKIFSSVFCSLSFMGSLITGIALIVEEYEVGIWVLVLGVLLSIISFMFFYGFGELIDRVCSIDEKISRNGDIEPKEAKRIEVKRKPTTTLDFFTDLLLSLTGEKDEWKEVDVDELKRLYEKELISEDLYKEKEAVLKEKTEEEAQT